MTSNEARQLTNKSLSILNDRVRLEAITKLETQIEGAAKRGEFTTILRVTKKERQYVNSYLIDGGFDFTITNPHSEEVTFNVRWGGDQSAAYKIV